jgi:hypothetical protein
MAAIEGLDLTIAGDDTVISAGMIDGTAVAAGTVDAAADADGDFLVVWDGAAFDHKTVAEDGDTVLGTATVGTALVTGVSYEGRGSDVPVTLDAVLPA